MAHRHVYEAIDRTLRDVRNDERPYGGLTTVFSGDWRQILPVIRKGSRADVVDACFKSSPLWQHVTVMKLTRNMRVAQSSQEGLEEDIDFAEHLLEIGEGRVPVDKSLGQFKVQLKDCFVEQSHKLEELAKFVFPDLLENYCDPLWLSCRAILCPTNEGVDSVNAHMMCKLPGASREYRSSDKIVDSEERHQYPEEFLNTLNPSGMAPHRILLKDRAPIMLLRNMDPIQGHCNGTRYVVNQLHDHIIDATVATGVHVGKRLLIPRIPLVPSENLFPFHMQRRQFPVRIAFAMTSNKAQGQTLSRLGIYLEKDFFSHGQLYVAMSRVGNPNDLKILTLCGYFNQPGVYADNVVYREVL